MIGYAMIMRKDISGETISLTERAAMVNGIMVMSNWRVTPLASWTDEGIREVFSNFARHHSARIVKLKIEIDE